MSHWQIAFCQGGSPRGKSPRFTPQQQGGVIYKEAQIRLCRASGIDRRFINAQIGFHGQLEGTDAVRGDWHPIFTALRVKAHGTVLMPFLTGKDFAPGGRTCSRQTDDKSPQSKKVVQSMWSLVKHGGAFHILMIRNPCKNTQLRNAASHRLCLFYTPCC